MDGLEASKHASREARMTPSSPCCHFEFPAAVGLTLFFRPVFNVNSIIKSSLLLIPLRIQVRNTIMTGKTVVITGELASVERLPLP